MPLNGSPTALAFFCLFESAGLAFAIATGYYLVRTQFGYEYRMLPSASGLLLESDATKAWERAYSEHETAVLRWTEFSTTSEFVSTKASFDFRAELEARIISHLVVCIDQNTANNDLKAANLHHAWSMILAQALFLALASIPYIYQKLSTQ